MNNANVGVAATVISDGTPNSPFHLSFTARSSGEAGRFTLDTGGYDLGLRTLSEGRDARVFFGSSDAATGVLLTSSTNSMPPELVQPPKQATGNRSVFPAFAPRVLLL